MGLSNVGVIGDLDRGCFSGIVKPQSLLELVQERAREGKFEIAS